MLGPQRQLSGPLRRRSRDRAIDVSEIAPGVAGGPRVVEATYTSAGVAVSFNGANLTDKTLDAPCSFTTGPDGKTRCFPEGIPGYFFSDAACSVRIGNNSNPCDVGPVKYINVQDSTSCAARVTRIYLPGAPLDPQTTDAYQLITGTCTLIPAGSTSGTKYYTLGAEVPPSTFLEGTPAKQ